MSAPGPLLPPDSRRDRPLLIVIVLLSWLAALAGLAAGAAWRAADAWTQDLAAQSTVQILVDERSDPDALAAQAAEALRALPGVTRADALPVEEAERLLEPWFGGALPPELPAPRLIAVEGEADAAALEAALEAQGIEAIADDHDRWEAEIRRGVWLAQIIALAAVGALVTAAAATVVFATNASLAARRDVIDALKIAGARDRFIAALFMRRFLIMGGKAGLTAAILAGLSFSGLVWAAASLGLLERAAPHWASLAALVAVPLLTGAISATTAFFAVINALREAD